MKTVYENIDFIVKGLLVSNKKKLDKSFDCYLHAWVILSEGCTFLTKPYGEGSFHKGCRYGGTFTNGHLYSNHLCSTATSLVPAPSPYIKAPFIWSRVPETTLLPSYSGELSCYLRPYNWGLIILTSLNRPPLHSVFVLYTLIVLLIYRLIKALIS